MEHVEATYDDFTGNAEKFYNLYGADNMKFFPDSENDGKIYFCSKGKTSTSGSGIKFRTVGWQFHLKNTRTGESCYLYYDRDGALIEQKEDGSITSSDGYTYNLYYINLKKGVKDRLDSKWLSALLAGEVELKVNACMTIVVNGTVKGSIDDNGTVTGTVYKTYDGIAGAAGWSGSTKESLKSYYNKTIDGLFHTVTIVKGNGIKNTTGSGTYLYGSRVQLSANIASGYQWNINRGSKWTGNDGYCNTSQNPAYTIGDHDVTLTASASNNHYTIYFQYGNTISSRKQIISYGSNVVLTKVEDCGFHLPQGYTYNSSKAWTVIRGSDDAVYCGGKGWVTHWRNGVTQSSDWNKYKDEFAFSLDSYWINKTGNAHGDDVFYFVLQTKRTNSVKVVFHKNYPGEEDRTYSETYYTGVSNQFFGMNLTGEAAAWAYWNKSPEGYYLPGDTSYGGGWSTNPNAVASDYSLKYSVQDDWIKSKDSELHLYMVRPVKKVKVIFHKNDGSSETHSETYSYNVGTQNFGMYLPAENAGFSNWKRSGYSGIVGWSESATAKTKHYNTCSGVGKSWIVQNCPQINLYAVWGSSIQITVNPNGGIWKGSSEVQQYTKEKGELLALPYPTRAGYTFLGWTWSGETGDGSRTSIVGFSQTQETQTGTDAVISYKSSGRYTNYKWTVNTAPASNAWNRLTIGTYPITAGHTYRISGEIRINEGSPTGVRIYHGGMANDYQNEKACYYAGGGWKSFSFDRTFAGGGTGYFECTTTNFINRIGTLSFDLKNTKVLDVTTGSYMTLDQVCSPMKGATNIAVTASWKGNGGISYKVHHYLMNTEGNGYDFWKTENASGVAGSSLYLENLRQTPVGFENPSNMVANGINTDITTIKGDGSTEIYIYYERSKFKLTVNAGTGIADTEIQGRDGNEGLVYYGAKVTVMAEMKEGYVWNESAGWSGTLQSENQTFSFSMPAQNVSVTANAMRISYKITYHLDGGTVTGNPDIYTVEDSFILNNPTKEGYEFQGWTGSNSDIPNVNTAIAKGTTGDLEFYANWENQEYYLAVNGFLNGVDDAHLLESLFDEQLEQNIGTFDMWIQKPGEEWYQDAAHVTEYSRMLPYGTRWKIESIEAGNYGDMFYIYDGMKMGEKGEKTPENSYNEGTMEGVLYETEWVFLVFTSWHKLRIGGYCDGQERDSVEGYGTFDVSISGKNAMGEDITKIGAGNPECKMTGNDVAFWEGYYPYGAQISVSDIKKDPSHINNEEYAEIIYEGLYEVWNYEESVTEENHNMQGNPVTTENIFSGILTKKTKYLLEFTSWYETILDQQGATTPGTEKIWHTISKAAYYKKAGEKSALETIVVPKRFGFVFRGYFTQTNGTGTQYIDQNGNFVHDLCAQKKNQKLYAFWTSEPPKISAEDSYFSLEEAQKGKITEDELLLMAEAWDEEEGQLQPGNHSGTIFGVEEYDRSLFLNLEQGAAVPVTYVAEDQAGNVCKQTVCVYVVNTIPQILTNSGSEIRFISKEYLDQKKSQGGLMDQSIWKKEDFYNILWECIKN